MVSRTFKTIKMNKPLNEPKERTEEEKLWELGSKAEPKDEAEEVQYTCCGNEITGEVEDIGLCPTCLEHI
jgi:hypothetical protein